MNPTLVQALIITAIGMGLVFLAIIALWGLMALVVRVFATNGAEAGGGEAEEAPAAEAAGDEAGSLHELRRRAAAAAVAVALARRKGVALPVLRQPSNTLSAWQAVMRADQNRSTQQRGPVR